MADDVYWAIPTVTDPVLVDVSDTPDGLPEIDQVTLALPVWLIVKLFALVVSIFPEREGVPRTGGRSAAMENGVVVTDPYELTAVTVMDVPLKLDVIPIVIELDV